MRKNCTTCNKLFTREQLWDKRKFCQPSCFYQSVRGKAVGDKAWNWKGGKSKDSRGYVRIHKGYMYRVHAWEHIIVMEQHLGRKLKHPEVVHHINGKKDDNRIENLYLCKDTAEHLRIHSGWVKREDIWWKPCSGCGIFLEVHPKNFYFRKNGKSLSLCKDKCAVEKNKRRYEK